MKNGQRASKPERPCVVLVHGAWLDGSCWREVIAQLQRKELKVAAVQHSLVSLASDVDAVHRVIERQGSRAILVGHAYGGTVITQAGNHPKVAALVFMAGFAPAAGESSIDANKGLRTPQHPGDLEIDSGGFVYLPQSVFVEQFAHDLPAVESRVLAAAQVPIHLGALNEKIGAPAWRNKPSWYLMTANDRMIDPRLQAEFAHRAKATPLTIKAGHVPFLSKPRETAHIVVAVTEEIGAR